MLNSEIINLTFKEYALSIRKLNFIKKEEMKETKFLPYLLVLLLANGTVFAADQKENDSANKLRFQ